MEGPQAQCCTGPTFLRHYLQPRAQHSIPKRQEALVAQSHTYPPSPIRAGSTLPHSTLPKATPPKQSQAPLVETSFYKLGEGTFHGSMIFLYGVCATVTNNKNDFIALRAIGSSEMNGYQHCQLSKIHDSRSHVKGSPVKEKPTQPNIYSFSSHISSFTP